MSATGPTSPTRALAAGVPRLSVPVPVPTTDTSKKRRPPSPVDHAKLWRATPPSLPDHRARCHGAIAAFSAIPAPVASFPVVSAGSPSCLGLLAVFVGPSHHGLVLGRQPYHWQSKTTKNVAGAATIARNFRTANLQYAACTDGAEDMVLIAKMSEDAIADSLKKRFMAECALRVRSNAGVSAT
jgi:hypothetical protein